MFMPLLLSAINSPSEARRGREGGHGSPFVDPAAHRAVAVATALLAPSHSADDDLLRNRHGGTCVCCDAAAFARLASRSRSDAH